MPRDWKPSYFKRLRERASKRGRAMAKRRWDNDRIRRDRLFGLNAEKFPGNIVRRIVVIDRESFVREAVIFDFDSIRSSRKKLRDILTR